MQRHRNSEGSLAFLSSQYLEMKVETGGGWITIGHTFQGQVVSFYKGVHSIDLEHNILSGVCRGKQRNVRKTQSSNNYKS